MAWFAGQSLVALLLAFLLGIVVGWLIWARRRDDAAATELLRAKSDLDSAHKDLSATQRQLEECRALTATGPRHLAEPVTEPTGSPEPTVADGPDSTDASPVPLAEATADTPVNGQESDGPVEDEPEDDLEDTSVSPERTAVALDIDDVPALAQDEPHGLVTTAPEQVTDGADEDLVADADGSDDAAVAHAAEADTEAETQADITEAAVTDAIEPVTDRIERIEGIGPKIGAALRSAGLGSFSAIAAATADELRAAIESGGVRFAPSLATWSRQAALLARGDEDGFQALTQSLVAGRDES